MTEEEITAYHEAGHAVAALVLSAIDVSASIESDDEILGRVYLSLPKASPVSRAVVCYAGPAAAWRVMDVSHDDKDSIIGNEADKFLDLIHEIEPDPAEAHTTLVAIGRLSEELLDGPLGQRGEGCRSAPTGHDTQRGRTPAATYENLRKENKVGKSTPLPTPPPDPAKVAAAQTSANVNSAIASGVLGNINQVGPHGSTSYNQTDTYTMTGPDGQTYQVPRYTQTTTLSPEQQQLYNQQTQLGGKMNNLALQQTDKLTGLLDKPVDTSSLPQLDDLTSLQGRQRVEQALFDRVNPQLERDRDQLETRLVNQGFQRGTQAFRDETDFRTARSMTRVLRSPHRVLANNRASSGCSRPTDSVA